jgi:hypothetical protein
MSDEHLYEGQSHHVRLRVWALGQMLWGGLLAGAVLAVIGAVLLAIWGVGMLLPEESKQAPAPYGALEVTRSVTDFA